MELYEKTEKMHAKKSSRVALLSFSKGRQILRVESENWACLLWTKFRIIWTLNTQPAHSLPLIYPFTIKSYISILSPSAISIEMKLSKFHDQCFLHLFLGDVLILRWEIE